MFYQLLLNYINNLILLIKCETFEIKSRAGLMKLVSFLSQNSGKVVFEMIVKTDSVQSKGEWRHRAPRSHQSDSESEDEAESSRAESTISLSYIKASLWSSSSRWFIEHIFCCELFSAGLGFGLRNS